MPAAGLPLPEEREIQALVRIYERAERELRHILDSATATKFQRGRATLLLRQVETIMTEVQAGTNTWTQRWLPVSFRRGQRAVAKSLKATLPEMSQIDRMAIETLAARTAHAAEPAIQSIAPLVENALRNSQQAVIEQAAMWREIAAGQIRGLGPQEMARRIELTLSDGAIGRLTAHLPPELCQQLQSVARGDFISIACRDGKIRRYNMRYYSNLFARTASRDAATEGATRTAVGFGVDLMQWSVHTGACPLCIPLQGKVFSISTQSADFPPLTDETRPPRHPHCGHVLVAAPEDLLRRRGQYDRLAEFSRDPQHAVNSGPEYQEFANGRARAQRTEDLFTSWSEAKGRRLPKPAEELMAAIRPAPG